MDSNKTIPHAPSIWQRWALAAAILGEAAWIVLLAVLAAIR